MRTTAKSLARTLTAAAALLAALAACGTKGGRDDYAKDGDSGAAAPATVPTPDASRPPDSTAGVSTQTGRPQGVAGDTLGGRHAPAKDSSAGVRPAGSRAPGDQKKP
ncbi:MAG TPA: hypothetical protein VKA84_08300 [Gemmatimonadaceae bacterium]|nr:hypothetical protein [Gemmatimonadaceae bacterium]